MNSPLSIGQLSRAILADEDGYVLVIRAYLDESGIHEGSPVITVAGYFARPKQWQAFTRAWNRILKPAGIKCFHASDCQALQGEFKGWDKADRDNLVAQLLPIIPQHAGAGLAISLVLEDFENALTGREELRQYLGEPYGACFQWLISTVLDTTQRAGTKEAIAVFHEQNDLQGVALRAFAYLQRRKDANKNLRSLTFGSKETYTPLQAADILAYEVGKRLLRPCGPGRRSFQAITPVGRKPRVRFYDKQNMPKLISKMEAFKMFHDAFGFEPEL